MASTTTRRKGGAPKSMEMLLELQNSPPSAAAGAAARNEFTGNVLTVANASIPTATVKRRRYGTGPFDENWLNLDCCGLFCAMITYGLHLYAMYAVCVILLPPWMSDTDEEGIRHLTWMGHFTRLSFSATALLAMAAHFKAMTTDPGAVPPDAVPLDDTNKALLLESSPSHSQGEQGNESVPHQQPQPPQQQRGKRLCRRCKTFKPKRAHHCSVCGRCIIKMDHHCPWVNNCVGIGNHKYFLLFVFYTFLSCLFSFTLVMTRFYSCMSRHGHVRTQHLTCLDHPTQLLSILGLVVEAILFGMFTVCMICDQSSVVSSKMTHIDRLKGGDGDDHHASSVAGVIEVFGLGSKRGNDPRFRPDWLSPFAKVCFPSSIQEEVMGFCRPCIRRNDSEPSPTRSGNNAPVIRSVAEIV